MHASLHLPPTLALQSRSARSLIPSSVALLFVPLLALGCADYQIRVASNHEALPEPEFVVARDDGSDEPLHYGRITVLQPDSQQVVWLTMGPTFTDDAPSRVRYGVAPDEFENRTFEPLEPGKSYRLVVSGPGHMGGTLTFHVDADGRLTEK